MGDETAVANGARERSRTPPRPAEKASEEHASDACQGEQSGDGDTGFAARMRGALLRQQGSDGDVEETETPNCQDETSATVDTAAVLDEETVYDLHCWSCRLGFYTENDLHEHVRLSVACCAEPWQAAVHAMACLPGAGTNLWCPACPRDFAGKWSGSAAKAGSLLRHLEAASSEGAPFEACHRRLLRTLVELLLVGPPPQNSDEDECLSEWASSSRLMGAAGPLLAKPNPVAHKAILKLQNEMLGSDHDATLPPVVGVCAVGDDDSGDEEAADVNPDIVGEKRLRILGLDLTVENSGLYDAEVPVCGGFSVPAPDGAEPSGPALPAGGYESLRCMDLTLSSDEEDAPVQKLAAPTDEGTFL